MAFAMLMPAQADNYFTMGENDTLRIRPSCLGGFVTLPVGAHFDGRLNTWNLTTITYPIGFHPESGTLEVGAEAGSDMTLTYKNSYNHDTVYNAILTVNTDFTTISSTIPVIGYHDYNHDGFVEPYGTVKWEAGDYYEMFWLRFGISTSFRSGSVIFDGYLSSDPDQRQGLISPNPFQSYREVYVYVGYKKGDLNGDEYVNSADVTLLINYVNNPDYYNFSEFQVAAADINGDGELNVTDITLLIGIVINS